MKWLRGDFWTNGRVPLPPPRPKTPDEVIVGAIEVAIEDLNSLIEDAAADGLYVTVSTRLRQVDGVVISTVEPGSAVRRVRSGRA